MLTQIKNLIAKINEECDEQFRATVQPDTNDEYIVLLNGKDVITEGYDFDVEARLKQIAKENQVELPKTVDDMNTVEDIIEHDPLGLL